MGTDNKVDMGIKSRGASAAGDYKRRDVKGPSQVYNDLPGAKTSGKGKILGSQGGGEASDFYNDLKGGQGENDSGSGPGRAHSIDGFGGGKNTFSADDDGDEDFYNNLKGGKGAKAVDGFSNSSGVIGGKV